MAAPKLTAGSPRPGLECAVSGTLLFASQSKQASSGCLSASTGKPTAAEGLARAAWAPRSLRQTCAAGTPSETVLPVNFVVLGSSDSKSGAATTNDSSQTFMATDLNWSGLLPHLRFGSQLPLGKLEDSCLGGRRMGRQESWALN